MFMVSQNLDSVICAFCCSFFLHYTAPSSRVGPQFYTIMLCRFRYILCGVFDVDVYRDFVVMGSFWETSTGTK